MNPDYVAFIWFALAVFVVWVLFLVIILFVHYDYERCANNEKADKEEYSIRRPDGSVAVYKGGES